MSLNETRIDIPAEHVSNIFGQFDHNIKLIERTLNVTVVPRNEGIKVIGDTANVEGACKVFAELLQLAERGNMIMSRRLHPHKPSGLKSLVSPVCRLSYGR